MFTRNRLWRLGGIAYMKLGSTEERGTELRVDEVDGVEIALGKAGKM